MNDIPSIRIKFSSIEDGSIAAGGGSPSLPEHDVRSVAFLEKHGFEPRGRARVFVTYLPENTYTHIERADQDTAGAIKCDALFTTVVGKTITLPVADCVATVVHDPVTRMLGVLHLGRHSSVAGLIEEFAIRVADELGSDPRDWHVWMSPSLQIANNALDYFEPPHSSKWQGFMKSGLDGKIHIDAPGHNRNCFERLGVAQGNISVSSIDTYTSKRYFSHRAAVEGGQPERQGRMMVAAALMS
jgi:copper oxidase (laccase) domain-containing protein